MAILRFHWDFFGPDSPVTAEHFLRHVEEFCEREGITGHRHWVTGLPSGCQATLECDERYLRTIRNRLRPKRAERVDPP